MARALGAKRVLFLANHGVVVVGPNIARAFEDLYYLERACQVQVLAQSTGRPLRRVSDNIAGATFTDDGKQQHYADAHFAALKRQIGSESWRERGWQTGEIAWVAVRLKKKQNHK